MSSLTETDGTVVRIAGAGPTPQLTSRVSDVDWIVASVGSTGVPAVEPLVAVTRGGRTAFYARCTPDRLAEIAASDGDAGTDHADAVVEHDPNAARLPSPDLGGLGVGERRVLGACGWRRPTDPADHEAAGGFADADAEAVLNVGADLRGRGWGDWCHDRPVADAWETVRASDEEGIVVVNAHGNPVDALLLASAPFEVLDGAHAVARAVDADRIVVYASSADERAVERVREAGAAHPNATRAVEVVAGPPSYMAAEPTMAVEAIEGNHRLEARNRPPGPEEFGLHGRPTLVHTPRTVAQLAVALREGGLADTRALTVTGDVAADATVELPESADLDRALDAVDVDGTLKAACVGGRFGGVTRSLDVSADPDALNAAGLGTEGTVRLLAAERCIVEFVGRQARFATDENCGRCVPCREGTTQLADALRDIYDGDYDRDGIEELVRVMRTSSTCAFGVRAGRPTRTAMTEFEDEFEAHADGRCPAGSCLERRTVS